jgi:Protein of unknown function (DUF1553)/Protein of unknown function (DUF1549)/Concanavalin A-like lectin/glucanases superfamily/Planctomycete cytochrome C
MRVSLLTSSTRFVVLTALSLPAGLISAPGTIEFNRDIRPILSDKCFTCHGPDKANRVSELRFDTEAGAKITLSEGHQSLVPGDPDKSELLRRIASSDEAVRMPPAAMGHAKLSNVEIDLMRNWIQQGAKWQSHWSFIPPKRPELPSVKNKRWPRNPIDALVLHRLEREGLTPADEADRATLIRRLSLDLTGLPPTPSEVDAFLNDSSPKAYEKVVDRLLASNRYGERMAARWLDAARYADTNGYQSDGIRSMWRWRDWVIDAFNRNLTFDRFTIEQLAGDMLPNASLDQRIASGFNRNHRTNAEGGIVPEEFRVEYVADRAETTSTVWLGLTVGCARCHDHKYDPIKQKEFYQLFAYFNNVPEKGLVYNFGNEEPYIKAPTPRQEARLNKLDARADAARKRYLNLQPEIVKAQREWEQSLTKAEPFDWAIRDGLVAHYPLDGLLASGCHEGRPVVSGSPDCSLPLVPAKVGKGAAFDGKRFIDAGDVGKFNYQDPFSLAAWIYPTGPNGAIMSRIEDNDQGHGYGLYLKEGKVRLHITMRWTDIGMRLETAEPLELNRWHHVVMSYDGKRKAQGVQIYLNGEAQKINVLFDELTWPIDPKDPFRIGAGEGPDKRFHGTIDEVRVYRKALSPEEAATLPLLETISEIAALPPERRSTAQSNKLAFCFIDQFAPKAFKEARCEWLDAERERAAYLETIPTVMVMQESQTPRETFLLKRGAYDAPGERVSPGVPAVLPPLPKQFPNNRLGLARWLVDPSNPLTSRVTVNRFWQMLFGEGLVKTVEDFGSQGDWPRHPELLDWLATRFVDSGWDVKSLLKTIVTSATYRQSSKVSPSVLERDPENRFLARGPRLRLPAEVIRDQALAASGLLVEEMGGPSVKPYQPPGLWEELSFGDSYRADSGNKLYRRSLYTYWKRTVAPPAMMSFDASNRESCTVRQTRTNTPLQALNLMNDVTYLEASRKLAERILKEGGSGEDERIAYGFKLVVSRHPKAEEAKVLRDSLQRFMARYQDDSKVALKYLNYGSSARDESLSPNELAAYTTVASLILNLDETITKE